MVKILPLFCPHLKADTPYGLNIILSIRLPKLPAKIADVHFQRTVRAVRRVLADAVQQQRFGDDLGWIPKEELSDGIFGPGQMNFAAGRGYRACIRIQGQIAESQDRGRG